MITEGNKQEKTGPFVTLPLDLGYNVVTLLFVIIHLNDT